MSLMCVCEGTCMSMCVYICKGGTKILNWVNQCCLWPSDLKSVKSR